MPIVTIEMWPMQNGKKAELIKRITDVFVDFGIPIQAVTIVIHENQLDNWGTGGEQHSIKFKDIDSVSTE